MVSRRAVITSALGLATGLAAGGCASSAGASTNAKWANPGQDPASVGSSIAVPANVTVTPADAAKDVSPTQPIVVTTDRGTLSAVTVTTAGGKTVAGGLDADQKTWRSTGALGYGQTYTVSATVNDGTSSAAPKTCSFTTVKPSSTVTASFQANSLNALKSGGTYGVGQPVIVGFSKAVSDRAAAEKAITIQTTPSVDGKFYWADNQTVHWRPENYWAKGTQITVKVNVFGVNLGKGVYGAANASTNFQIGRSLIAVGDTNAHTVQVYIDGQLVRSMPSSFGKGGYTKAADGSTIDFFTRSGVHVVLEKDQTVNMNSASYGITNKNDPNYYTEDVQLCTRISYSGEYLHAAPWNHSLGKANLSHGCLNLSTADAQWVYNTFIVGDIVQVKGSPVNLPVWDGIGDWTVPYAQYGK